eukprot:7232341-Pyramimonas_sp.AAC.1
MRFKHGDIGAFFDGVSDAPDLVVARVFVPRDLESAAGPSPVLRIADARPPPTWEATRSPPSSAAQPAASSN